MRHQHPSTFIPSHPRIEYLYLHVLCTPLGQMTQSLKCSGVSNARHSDPKLHIYTLLPQVSSLWSLDQMEVQGKAARMGRGQERVSAETEPEAWRTEGQVGADYRGGLSLRCQMSRSRTGSDRHHLVPSPKPWLSTMATVHPGGTQPLLRARSSCLT